MNTATPPNGVTERWVSRRISRSSYSNAWISFGTDLSRSFGSILPLSQSPGAFGQSQLRNSGLKAAQRVDRYVQELWETLQAMPEYKGNTSLILAVDHGRGVILTQQRGQRSRNLALRDRRDARAFAQRRRIWP